MLAPRAAGRPGERRHACVTAARVVRDAARLPSHIRMIARAVHRRSTHHAIVSPSVRPRAPCRRSRRTSPRGRSSPCAASCSSASGPRWSAGPIRAAAPRAWRARLIALKRLASCPESCARSAKPDGAPPASKPKRTSTDGKSESVRLLTTRRIVCQTNANLLSSWRYLQVISRISGPFAPIDPAERDGSAELDQGQLLSQPRVAITVPATGSRLLAEIPARGLTCRSAATSRPKGTIVPRTTIHAISSQTGSSIDSVAESDTLSSRTPGKLVHGCSTAQKSAAKRNP